MPDAVNRFPESLRAARVADTEDRILAAARERFVRDGYSATTLAAVADAAGVAHRTVYVRFGTKAALLRRVIDVAVVGDREPIPLADREATLAALTAPTLEERIELRARAASEIMARMGDVIAVALQAEGEEPLIAESARAGREATRESVRTFVGRLFDDGLVRKTVDPAWLVDTLAILMQAETWVLARRTLGWTPEDYRVWLVGTLRRLLAAAGPG